MFLTLSSFFTPLLVPRRELIFDTSREIVGNSGPVGDSVLIVDRGTGRGMTAVLMGWWIITRLLTFVY